VLNLEDKVHEWTSVIALAVTSCHGDLIPHIGLQLGKNIFKNISAIRRHLYGGCGDNTVEENSSIFSLICMHWLPSARACGQ